MDAARTMPTCADLVQAAAERLRAAGIETARLDAEVLMALALQTDRTGLYVRLHTRPTAGVEAHFSACVARRDRREPLAYITGVQEFWSLPFAVNPSVLIPRPETELLVEIACRLAAEACGGSEGCGGFGVRELAPAFGWAGGGPQATSPRPPHSGSKLPHSKILPQLRTSWSICDVGTGSGCLAVALARELPAARIVAVDVSADALATAARNAAAHGVVDRIALRSGDLFDGLAPDERFDVIVSNPPYLSPHDAVSAELWFEPRAALAAGADGLDVIRRLVAAAPHRLRSGGSLVMELGSGQETAVRALARAAGFVSVGVEPDLAGIPRALIAGGFE